jgi:GTP cyclohydrolase II
MLTEDVKNILQKKLKIIHYTDTESICLAGPVRLPIQLDQKVVLFKWYTWIRLKNDAATKEEILERLATANLAEFQQSSILVYGDFENVEKPYVRFHSICHTGDIFGSKRCDCGFQLRQSLKMIVENGCGALFYLANHEGRGIGLFSKSLAYLLQEEGYDTVEANHALGFEDDLRKYDEPLVILQYMRAKPVILITNNPRKLAALRKKGLSANSHLPLWGDVSEYNQKYLETKVLKSGHIREQVRISS